LNVYLWWTEKPGRCTNVPIEVYDDTILLDDSIRIDQRSNGGQWNLIGSYTFSGTPKVVIISEGDTCGTNADALRMESFTSAALDSIQIEGPLSVEENSTTNYNLRAFYVDGSERPVTEAIWGVNCPDYASISSGGLLSTIDVSADKFCQVSASYSEGGVVRNAVLDITIQTVSFQIIDNGGSGTSSTGTWSLSSGSDYYGSQSVFNREPGGGTYTFTANSLSGALNVYLWWTEKPGRCTNVPIEVYDDTILLDDSIRIDQRSNGGQWNLIGSYTFSGTPKVVIISEGDTCGTNADALRFDIQ
jgi:hypothetical protein